MDPQRKASLDRGFSPRAIVVVGDKRPTYSWLKSYKEYTGGPVYSVQLDPNEIPGIEELGIPNYKSLEEVPDPVDYVLIAVPRRIVPRIVADCIKKGVSLVASYTAGFAETHEEEGIQLSAQIQQMAREAGLNLVGPNCLGIGNLPLNFGMTGWRLDEGQEAMSGVISMSGANTGAIVGLFNAHGLPVKKCVSMGNGIVLDQADWLEYLAADDDIKIIGMYLEGAPDGRKFFNVLKDVASRKPVIILKGGQTALGARAAASHTASLASSTDVWWGMFKQTGAIGVYSPDELVDVAKLLTMTKPIKGTRMGIIASTGGQSVLSSDAMGRAGLDIPRLEQRHYDILSGWFSGTGNSYNNPLDVTGMLNSSDAGQRMLELLAEDSNVDVIAMEVREFIVRGREQDFEERMMDVLQEFHENSPNPFVVMQTGFENQVQRYREMLRDRGIPAIYSFNRAAQAIRRAYDYHRIHEEIQHVREAVQR